MTRGPAMRETSLIPAARIGGRVLHEPFGGYRPVAAGLMA